MAFSKVLFHHVYKKNKKIYTLIQKQRLVAHC